MKGVLLTKIISLSILILVASGLRAACNLSSTCQLKNDTSLCANKTLKLATCSDTTNFKYKWRGISASPLNKLTDTITGSPTFSSSTTGIFTYTVTATRKNDNTCFFTDTITINVTAAAIIPVISALKSCAGDTLKISVAQNPGETYSWTGPGSFAATGNTITRANATTLFSGSYSVTVTTTGACRVLASKTITVSNPIVNAGRDTSSCSGMNIKIGANPAAQGGIAPYTYLWTANGDTLSSTSIANPVASPNHNSFYTLRLTDSAGCTAGPDTVKIVVGTCNQMCEGVKGPNLLGAMGTFSAPYIVPNNTTSDACIRNGSVEAPLNNIGSAKPTQTTYAYAQTSGGMGPEGRYTFVKSLGNGSTGTCLHGDFRGVDHTGNGGYFMAINGSPNINSYGATFFKLDSIEVCPNTDYEFSAWITNLKTGMQTHGANSYPNIAFFINDVIVASSGDVMPTTGQWANDWRKSGGTWFSNETRYANIRIDNYTFVASGNDLGLDDITFGICGPVIVSRTSKNIYCQNEYIKVRDSVACTNGRTYSYYRWQKSTDGGNTWTYVSGLQSSNNSAFYPVSLDSFQATLAMDGDKYRVAVALDSNTLKTTDPTCTIYGNATTIRVRPLPIVTIQAKDTICPSVSAQLKGIGSSGTQPYTYTWSNNLNGTTATGINYNLTVPNAIKIYVTLSDSIGCIAKDSTELTPAPLFTTSVVATNVLCFGTNTGTATVSTIGNTNPYTIVWNDANTTFNRSALNANTYSYTVTDRFGCINTGTATLSQPSVLAATASTQIASCFNGNNGSITQTITGGTTPYSFTWSDAANTQSRTGLSAGSYNVTITDANGCTLVKTYSIANADSITVSGTQQNIKCHGAATGSITLTAAGGATPYTYIWNDGVTTGNRTAVAAGTFAVTVTDNKGCTKTANFTLTEAVVLNTTTTNTNVNCYAASNGTASATVTGGVSPYTFVWSNAATTASLTSLAAGTYTITVKDANNCTAIASAIVSQPAVSVTATLSKTDISCNAGNNGTITTSVSGGTTPYTYNWGAGITTKDRAALTTGTYNLTVTDANNCSATKSITLSEPAAIVLSATSVNINCNGAANGSIASTATGGTGAFTYSWSNAATTKDISALSPGTYTVTIADANNCTKTIAKTITEPTVLTTNAAATNVNCFGASTGTASTTVTGGVTPYSFVWSNAATTASLTNLAAGTYTVTVKDANNCSAIASATVAQPAAALNITLAKTDISCNAGNNGTITTAVSGGTTPYTYNWGAGITTKDLAALIAGTYNLTVTDANNCSATKSITLSEPAAIALSATSVNISCNGAANGSIATTATGGTGTFTYSWSNAATTKDISALSPGTYTVTIADANNCTKTVAKSITEPTALTTNAAATNVNCFGASTGTASTTVTGGVTPYSFVWSNAATAASLTNLAAGTYTVTVKDANNCSAIASATVAQPAAALNITLAKTDISCNAGNNGTITTSVSGGTTPYTYNWGAGITTKDRTASAAGTYNLTVTDANNCSATKSISLSEPAAIVLSATSVNINCNGAANGSIATTATGGTGTFTYSWSNAATTKDISALSPATYTVTIADANNCTKTIAKTITEPTALTVQLNSANSACTNANGTATAVTNNTGTAPYTYTWSNGGANSQNQNGLAPGSIAVTVTDAKGCTAEAATLIAIANNNTDANFTVGGSFCAPNAQVAFTHSGSASPLSHSWSFGTNGDSASTTSTTYIYNTAGTYNITHIVTRGFCADTVTKQVVITNAPIASTVALSADCFGSATGAISATVANGTSPFTYIWSNAATTNNINNLSAGTYTLTVKDAAGCADTTTTAILQPTALTVSGTTTNTNCHAGNNGSITLSAAGGTAPYQYIWSNNATSQDINNLAAGTYSVTVKDIKNCTVTLTFTISSPAALSTTATATPATCFGISNGSIAATATGGTTPYSYNWGAGITTQNRTSIAAGNYAVTVKDAMGCSSTANATVAQPVLLTVATSATDAKCFGTSTGSSSATASGGTSPYSYKWSSAETTQTISNKTAGNYTATVTDANGCTTAASATIGQPTALSATTTSTQPSCFGASNATATVTATGATAPYTIAWNNGNTQFNRNALSAGTYTATITDAKGCTTTQSVSIAQPDSLKAAVTANTAALCFGASNATATITATGGTPTYTILWNDGNNTFSRNNLSAGNYQVTISDSKACSRTISFTTIQAAQLASAIATKDVSCFNGSNGSANASVTGGTAPFAFLWSNGSTNDSATNLSKGNYSLTITDANGCTLTKSISINQPELLTIAGNPTAVSCFAGSNGTITTTTTGGTAPYTFKWSNNKTTAGIQTLVAASYTVTATDNKGCSTTESFTVNQPDSISITSSTQQPLCFGAANGSINTAATGGNGNYTFQWSNGKTTANNSALAQGNYSLTVTDAKACTATRTFSLGQPTALTETDTVINISCFNANDGRIKVTAAGGTNPYTLNWSNGSTSTSLSNLSAGTYTVTITDANGCSITKAIVISQPLKLTVATGSKNVTCFNGNNGMATAKAAGGTSPYNFSWSNGNTNDTISNLVAAQYTVTLTDANGCSSDAAVTIAQPTTLTASTSKTDVSCFGGNTGAINVSATRGVSPYTVKWNDNTTSMSKSALVKGTYSATVTDANGCTVTIADTITEPTKITIATTSSDVLCNGGNTGAITTTIAGGVAPYTFIWSDNNSSQNRTNLSAATYKLTVTDNAACTATSSAVVVNQPATLSAQLTAKNVVCYNGNNGSAIAKVQGGKGAYSFNWSNAASNDTISNLVAGTYTVTISDSNACSITKSIAVNQPDSLTLNGAISNPLCYGAATGSLMFNSIGGGTPGYTFKWSNGVQQSDLNNVAAGTYTLTVTDMAGCKTSKSFSITQPFGINIQLSATQNKCFGDSAAAITLTATGGTGTLSYKWSNGKTTAGIGTLKAATYSVTVTDANGCKADTITTITQTALLQANAVIKNNKCFGQTNGSITLQTSGGVQPYSYAWSTGATTDSIANLAKGTYNLTITDANNCSVSNSFTITQPDTLHLGITATNPNCTNQKSGMVMFNSISGGTPGYTFVWSNSTFSSDLTNIGAGTYTVTITDLNGCTTAKSYTLTQPDSMVATALITNPACSGTASGNINLTVNGGTAPYIYNWSNGKVTQDLQNLAAGNYSVQISDSKGCYIAKSYIVTQPAPLTFPVSGSTKDVSCNGGTDGTINTAVSGGNTPYTYKWSNNATTANLSNIAAGSFAVTITDAGNCSATKQFTINQPTALIVKDSVKNISCNGLSNGSVKLMVSGGSPVYTYTWSNAANTANISALAPATYSVTIADAKNCSATRSFSISQPAALALQGTATPVKCAGSSDGKVVCQLNGGTQPYRFNWNTNETKDSITNKPAGNYSVSVTDAFGCTTNAAFTIGNPAPLVLGNAKNDITCFGKNDGIIDLNVHGGTPGYTYSWSNGMSVNRVANLAKGKYYVTVKDRNNCAAKDSNFISEPSPVQLAATITDVRCFGDKNGSVSVAVNGGAQPYYYTWSTGASTPAIQQLGADKYYVTVTDAALCTNVGVATVTQPAAIANQFSKTANKCFGDSTALLSAKANGGKAPYAYNWNTGSNNDTIFNLAPNRYSVTITDANGCSTTDTSSIHTPAAIVISTEVMDASCEGKSDGTANVLVTQGTAPYTFLWNGGGTTQMARNLAKNSYYVTVTDANGCSRNSEVVVNEFPSMKADVQLQHIGCKPGTDGQIHLTPNGGKAPYRYTWSNGNSTSAISTTSAGNFTVTITDRNGCAYDTTLTITAASGISINTIPAKTIKLGESVELTTTTSSQDIASWNWTPTYSEAGLDCDNCQSPGAAPTTTTTYHVTAVDERGCEAHDTVTITVIPDHSYFVPNLFSPNGDGSNDVFSFYGNVEGIAKFEILIFNRWGEKIFESDDPKFKWDGTYKNVMQDPGVYVYVITMVFKDNAKPDDDMKGSITIVR